MKYSNELKNDIQRLSKMITNELKNRIKQLDLIDTGRMFSITESDIKFTMDGLDIEITTTDYYKYLDGDYDLTDYVFNLPNISNLINSIYGDMVVEIIMNEI